MCLIYSNDVASLVGLARSPRSPANHTLRIINADPNDPQPFSSNNQSPLAHQNGIKTPLPRESNRAMAPNCVALRLPQALCHSASAAVSHDRQLPVADVPMRAHARGSRY